MYKHVSSGGTQAMLPSTNGNHIATKGNLMCVQPCSFWSNAHLLVSVVEFGESCHAPACTQPLKCHLPHRTPPCGPPERPGSVKWLFRKRRKLYTMAACHSAGAGRNLTTIVRAPNMERCLKKIYSTFQAVQVCKRTRTHCRHCSIRVPE